MKAKLSSEKGLILHLIQAFLQKQKSLENLFIENEKDKWFYIDDRNSLTF